MPDSEPKPYTISPESRKLGVETAALVTKGRIIRNGSKLEDSLMEAAQQMREQVSQPAREGETPAGSAERRVEQRAAAGVLSRIAISWNTVLDRVRIAQGKPLPGQKRPIPDELKQPKPRKSNLPPEDV